MLSQLAKTVVLGSVLGALCLPMQANTTALGAAAPGAAAPDVATPEVVDVRAAAVPSAVDAGTTIVRSELAPLPAGDTAAAPGTVRVALLLPLRSDTLRSAAEAVRAGVQAAYEREQDGIVISVVETGDAPQDILNDYKSAVTQHDIVVGPLSRTAVAAVAQSGAVGKPTIALTAPEGSADLKLPQRMLVMGLSIEEEARQVADWARRDHPAAKAVVLLTKAAWQRRAAKAFEMQWQQRGLQVETIELLTNDGFLNGRELLQLKKQLQSETPVVLFAALDARQARQVRAILGKGVSLYGTSQLNPIALSDRLTAERMAEMDGTRLSDIPWQLQEDHPAVMVYPRQAVNADQQRSADLERLYALGIDAYRVARAIAAQQTSFELDGVTGRLSVRFGSAQPRFERTIQRAVYRDGGVVSAARAP
ncbi:MAG: penicillin-binding protein activator [Noviherbaspirillum sp.]